MGIVSILAVANKLLSIVFPSLMLEFCLFCEYCMCSLLSAENFRGYAFFLQSLSSNAKFAFASRCYDVRSIFKMNKIFKIFEILVKATNWLIIGHILWLILTVMRQYLFSLLETIVAKRLLDSYWRGNKYNLFTVLALCCFPNPSPQCQCCSFPWPDGLWTDFTFNLLQQHWHGGRGAFY